LFPLTLASCAVPANNQATEQQLYQRDAVICTREPLTQKNAVQQTECLNKAEVYHAQRAGIPYIGLIYQEDASDLQAAVDYSEGRITLGQYHAEAAQIHANYVQAVQSFQAQQNAADAVRTQNFFNALSNYGAQQQQIQQQQQQNLLNNAPQTTNCRNTYNGMSCTTW